MKRDEEEGKQRVDRQQQAMHSKMINARDAVPKSIENSC